MVKRFPSLGHVKVRFDSEAFDGNSSDILATKSSNEVILNADKFADTSLWPNFIRDWAGSRVDSTPYGVVVHELGHIADGQLLANLGAKRYNLFVARILPGIDFASISNEYTTPYGQENLSECIAELFAMYVSGKPALDTGLGPTQYGYAKAFWEAAREHL